LNKIEFKSKYHLIRTFTRKKIYSYSFNNTQYIFTKPKSLQYKFKIKKKIKIKTV